ncbi:MAG: molybdenum cofactor guanylyltransferase MobA [Comamonas sp.]
MVGTDITGLVLAGGEGSRMGHADKGLVLLQGRPLAAWAAQQLAPQVGPLLLNANRHIAQYQTLGWPVVSDAGFDGPTPRHAGPLAGFLAGLEHCRTPWLVTVPCDTPRFPADLVARLAAAAQAGQADIAMVCTPDDDGASVLQPVFCLMKASLQASLRDFLEQGGQRVRQWAQQHAFVQVLVEPDGPASFFNANTPADLQWLEQSLALR